MSFAIARQPVFDTKREIYGYEIYLRRSDNLTKYPEDIPYNKATFIVAELIAELGISKISEGKRIFFNVTIDSLLNRVIDILPVEMVAFELMPPQIEIGETVYSSALKRIEELKSKGASIVLTEKLYSGKYADILKICDTVEFSAQRIDEGKVEAVKRNHKKLLVSRIEKQSEYESVIEFADFLEGNYLAPPVIIKEFELAPFLKSTLMRMIGALNSVQSVKEFADIIASDVGMSAKLLRFVNSAYFSRRKGIKDIVQACTYLGMENLKKFTLLVATNDYLSVEDPHLWKRSLIRAYLAQEIMKEKNPSLANEAYLAGLFSLIDKILGVDKIEFLREVGIDKEIIDAFTGANEELSFALQKAVLLEEASEMGPEKLDKVIDTVAKELGKEPVELSALIAEAKSQAEEIIRV